MRDKTHQHNLHIYFVSQVVKQKHEHKPSVIYITYNLPSRQHYNGNLAAFEIYLLCLNTKQIKKILI